MLKLSAWGVLCALVFVTLCPIGLRPTTETTVNLDRFLAFGLAGLLLAVAYPRHWRLIALVLPIATFGTELSQFLSATRHAQLPDALFKAAGSVIGVLAGHGAVLKTQARRCQGRTTESGGL